MKNLFFTLLVMCSILSVNAQNTSRNRIIVHKADKSIVGYAINAVDSLTFDQIDELKATLTIVSTEETSAVVNVQRTADCESYLLAYEPAANWDGQGSLAERIKTINHSTYTTDGNLTLTGMRAGTIYNIYTLAYDKYGIEGETSMISEKIGTGEEEMFTVTFSNITPCNVGVKIVPKDPDMYYSWMLHTKEHYDNTKDENGDMYQYDLSWWNFMSEQTGQSWDECMRQEIVKGTIDVPESNWLIWDTDYVVTIYGINENDAAPLTKTMVVPVRTTTPTPSDNVITVELGEVYYNGVDVKVTTTNNDVYLVGSERKEYVDYYTQNGTFLQQWISDVHDNLSIRHQGNDEFKKTTVRPDADYYLIVCGYNDGPTTEVQLIPFHTKKVGE